MPDTDFHWTSASRSHMGMVRQVNEDSCLDQAERGLWAVADGMGGHTLGDLASRMVIESLNQLPPATSLSKFMADARDRLQTVNRQLRNEAASRGAHIIGSTVVVLLAQDGLCGYLWAGDSRIYLLRDGRLRRLTRDHSQVEELMSSGTLAAEETIHLVARNLITRAVGVSDGLELDEETIEVQDGDIYLLCSDGLSNEVDEQDIRNALAVRDCRQSADALIDMALQNGGRDNVSAVVVRAMDLFSTEKTVLNPAVRS